MLGVSKKIERKEILRDISLSFYYGAKIGVLGLNGSGKSSLMRILAGRDTDIDGKLHFEPGYAVGFLEQEPQLTAGKTVRACVEEGVGHLTGLVSAYDATWDELDSAEGEAAKEKILQKQGELQEKIDTLGAWDIAPQVEMAMDALRCPPGDRVVDDLSGGERRRVALTRLLLQTPSILLLDEPTNHLDAESVNWLEQHLARYEGTVIAVTHDRYFLDNVAQWILELDHGHGIPWKGNFNSGLARVQKQRRLAVEANGPRTAAREAIGGNWNGLEGQSREGAHEAEVAGPSQRLRNHAQSRRRRKGARPGDHDSSRAPAGGPRGRGQGLGQGLRRQSALRGNGIFTPSGGIVGVVGPNGAGKATLFPDDRGSGKAGCGHLAGGRDRQGRSCRPVPGFASEWRDHL